MSSSNKIPLAFCCKENPCGVVVGKLTTCCSEEDVVVNVCLVPQVLCDLTKTQSVIYTGTIEGYVEEESCFELTCESIDYLCGEDDLPEDADSGNCCPVGTGVVYVPWDVAIVNLSESTAIDCAGCCDDIGDPDPCGPFGGTLTMSYFYRAFKTQGVVSFDDGKSCPGQNVYVGNRFAGPPTYDAHPEIQNISCCDEFTCDVSMDTGGLTTQAPDAKAFTVCSSCECANDQVPTLCAPHVGPIANTYEHYVASCSIPKTLCYFSGGVGGANYEGPGELILSRFTGERRTTTATCSVSGVTKTVEFMRSRIVPGPAVQGIWTGSISYSGFGTTRAWVRFTPDDPSTPEGSEAYFYKSISTTAGPVATSVSEAWDPVGDSNRSYTTFEKCGNPNLTGSLAYPQGQSSTYLVPPPTSFDSSIRGPNATPWSTNSWDTFWSPQLFQVPDICCSWISSGGKSFQVTIGA